MNVGGGREQSFLDPGMIVNQIGSLAPGMLVADFGCGAGFFTIELAHRLDENGRVYAVDVQKDVLDAVKEKSQSQGLKGIEFVHANLETVNSTPIGEKSLDMVWMVNVLFQNKAKDGLFKEAYRVLKPGAELVVVDWVPNQPLGPDGLRLSQDEVQQLGSQTGFQFVRSLETGEYHHGSVFNKPAQ